jgi:TIR domain-containing protein
MAGGIFISYRRDDNRYAAGRLYDALNQRFPGDQIFIDVNNIEPGLNFLRVIQDKVDNSDAMLVVIGPNWLSATDADGKRRLDHPNDLVRKEIEAGLKRDIRVIPVLVDGGKMPSSTELPESLEGLAWLNAVTLHHDSFKHDAERLANALAKAIEPKTKSSERKVVEKGGVRGTKSSPGPHWTTRADTAIQRFLR